MISALLIATVDWLISQRIGYNAINCKVMPDDRPSPLMGDFFLSVHQSATTSNNDNCLNESYSYNLTLTMRTSSIPRDRIGDVAIVNRLANAPGPNGAMSFNARIDQLRSMLHLPWGILQDANNILIAANPQANEVYGFYEPPRYRTVENPTIVYDDWFDAEPADSAMGVKATISIQEAKRLQPIATYV